MAGDDIKLQITANRILFYWRICVVWVINNINLNIWSFKGETILASCDDFHKVKNLFRGCLNYYSIFDSYLLDFSYVLGNREFYRILWKWKIYLLYTRSYYWLICKYFHFLLTKGYFLLNFKHFSFVKCADNHSDVFVHIISPFILYRPSNHSKKPPFASIWLFHFC